MKKSSMKTAPKGRMPPIMMVNGACMYHGCSGMCRGIWLEIAGLEIKAAKAEFDKPGGVLWEVANVRGGPAASRGANTPRQLWLAAARHERHQQILP